MPTDSSRMRNKCTVAESQTPRLGHGWKADTRRAPFCRFYQRTVLSTSGDSLYPFINGRPRFTFEIDGAREGLPAAMAKPYVCQGDRRTSRHFAPCSREAPQDGAHQAWRDVVPGSRSDAR